MNGQFRFHPPPVGVSIELRWVLECAFAPAQPVLPRDGIDVIQAVSVARRLGLDARIGARLRGRAVGPLEELTRARAHATASVLRARSAAEVVAEIAAAKGIPCCFLKGMALEALGVNTTASRPMSDLDVLPGANGTQEIDDALRARGFVPSGEEYPHQLAPRVHPHLGSVELHRHLPGVRLGARSAFATLEELERQGLTLPWSGMPGRALLPVPALLVAHMLAHGLAQHGFSPGAYPPLRWIGDLIDLGMAGNDGNALLERALPLIERSVPHREARAAIAVCEALSRGDVAALADDSGDRGRMFRHLIAGVLDPRYRAALTLQDVRHSLGDGGRLRNGLAATRNALLLSRGQIDAIYGPPRHPWGYAARRMLRPFDLVWRAGRALLS